MNKISYVLMLAGILTSAAPLYSNDSSPRRPMRCEECRCGSECRCEENIRKTASVIGTEDLGQLQAYIASNKRVIVKFYLGKCPACSFGTYFTELVQDPANAEALFIAFNATPVQNEVKGLYGLPSLPAIVLFVDGQEERILKI